MPALSDSNDGHRILGLAAAGWICAAFCLLGAGPLAADTASEATEPKEGTGEGRRPPDEGELRYWLQNMVVYHRFSDAEIQRATGMNASEVDEALDRFKFSRESRRTKRVESGPLVVLPYPGGRHPRIGFLEGAVHPQRETKVSVFTPWDPDSYVVLDVPEAIWSNLGLAYLAHTHIDTVWTKRGIVLPRLEWKREENGALECERVLPNGIRFGTKVVPRRDRVEMAMWLTNGTTGTLSDLRVQNCVMLKRANGFAGQTNENKHLSAPYIACGSEEGRRWIVTGWDPCDRVWANPPVPCLHSDPKFPDCAPGETKTLVGWLSFYEGDDIDAEIARIEATGWRKRNKGRR